MKKHIYRCIIFSKTPLKGAFRYGNEFQILQFDSQNIRTSKYCQHFPLFLEFVVEGNHSFDELHKLDDKDFMNVTSGYINHLNKITRLLSSITNHEFFTYNNDQGRWSFTLPEKSDEKETFIQSYWSLPGYHYERMKQDLRIEQFSTGDFSKIKLIEHKQYFSATPLDDKNNEILFPETINPVLQSYYNLSNQERKMVDNVTSLIANGINLRTSYSMKSLSFVSFISAIETIADFALKEIKGSVVLKCHHCKSISSSPYNCPECGEPAWGIGIKFRSFLKEYVAKSENSEKKFGKIYSLRSKIVHHGSLLLGDSEINWGDLENPNGQWFTHIETMQLARLSLTNWLMKTEAKKIKIKHGIE